MPPKMPEMPKSKGDKNIILVSMYLYSQLSFSILLGLFLSLIICYTVTLITHRIQ